MARAAAKGGMTPWELRLEGGNTRLTTLALLEAEDLKLFDKWCIAQCQHKSGSAVSYMNLCPIQGIDDQFSKWKRDRLNGTMGGPITPRLAPMMG